LLFFDALNFSRSFFSDHNFWNLVKPFKKIKDFVEAAQNADWEIEVFIDEGIKT
jgi:hypothetical protein